METPHQPIDPDREQQVRLESQAKRIDAIVDKDRRRRRNTVYFLVLTSAVTLALAALALRFGRADKDLIRATSA